MTDASIYRQIFDDSSLVAKIKEKLPELFLLAEHDNSRNGKLGMEVGSARERIIIAMLMYKFGEENVNAELPITSAEVDVIVHDLPLSIKTVSGARLSGVKLIWTVDPQKALAFMNEYVPSCDMILTQLNWGGVGHLYLFPQETQTRVLAALGRETYIKLPKQGTNPRGVELSQAALQGLVNDPDTLKIDIDFTRQDLDYNAYQRWLEYWQQP